MQLAAVALAIMGFAVGMMFRVRVLLPILLALLVVSAAFSLARGFTFLGTVLAIMGAQAIVQASYFLGVVARAIFAATDRMRRLL
jgi:hypothetical protein